MCVCARARVLDVLLGWHTRSRATVLGQELVAGESAQGVRRKGWKGKRCSSVITTVIRGYSRHGVVKHFIERIDQTGEKYAVIEWLPRPTCPYRDDPVIVRLRDNDMCVGLPFLVSNRDVDPCGVCIERCDVEACMYVCRTNGLDTFPSHN